jgi:hypothetical protein
MIFGNIIYYFKWLMSKRLINDFSWEMIAVIHFSYKIIQKLKQKHWIEDIDNINIIKEIANLHIGKVNLDISHYLLLTLNLSLNLFLIEAFINMVNKMKQVTNEVYDHFNIYSYSRAMYK